MCAESEKERERERKRKEKKKKINLNVMSAVMLENNEGNPFTFILM